MDDQLLLQGVQLLQIQQADSVSAQSEERSKPVVMPSASTLTHVSSDFSQVIIPTTLVCSDADGERQENGQGNVSCLIAWCSRLLLPCQTCLNTHSKPQKHQTSGSISDCRASAGLPGADTMTCMTVNRNFLSNKMRTENLLTVDSLMEVGGPTNPQWHVVCP